MAASVGQVTACRVCVRLANRLMRHSEAQSAFRDHSTRAAYMPARGQKADCAPTVHLWLPRRHADASIQRKQSIISAILLLVPVAESRRCHSLPSHWGNKMTVYRCFCLTRDNRIITGAHIDAIDMTAAVETARQRWEAIDYHSIEVWFGTMRIYPLHDSRHPRADRAAAAQLAPRASTARSGAA